ncbi:putative galactolipase [Helianthus annuus]|nr:putative galactolipase [Helianthus annuus]
MVAVAEVIMERSRRDPTWSAKDYQFLVLSLGTGCLDMEEKYDATKSSTWGILGWWLRSGGSSPVLNVFSSGYSYMADYFASAFLKGLNSEVLYLQIHVHLTFCFFMLLQKVSLSRKKQSNLMRRHEFNCSYQIG